MVQTAAHKIELLSTMPTVYCGNISVGYLVTNPFMHARIKHIEIDFYLIRENIANGVLFVEYTPTKE